MGDEILLRLKDSIINQDAEVATRLAKEGVDAGLGAGEIIDAISAGLRDVGDMFERKELFLPEVVRAANAAKSALAFVIPMIKRSGDKDSQKKRVAIGSLGPHDIGKTIITSMLIAEGFDVLDLGIMLTPEKAERLIKENGGADLLALSVLLTSDIRKAAEIIARAKAVDPRMKVMVGGAAMSNKVAKEIGADAFGSSGEDAIRIAKGFCRGGQ
ncbi:MAG: cobalamin-dependent protein [Candidatus Methanomethylicia archaeon]|nr:cobalamin-dependent protein [Candidatus Methanomethylicia archaeon]